MAIMEKIAMVLKWSIHNQ